MTKQTVGYVFTCEWFEGPGWDDTVNFLGVYGTRKDARFVIAKAAAEYIRDNPGTLRQKHEEYDNFESLELYNPFWDQKVYFNLCMQNVWGFA